MRSLAVLTALAFAAGCHVVSGLDAFEVGFGGESAAGNGGAGGGGGTATSASTSGVGAAGGGAGGSGGGAGGEETCAAVVPCSDPAPMDLFEAGSIGSMWNPQLFNDITAEQVGGILRFTVPPGTSTRYGSIRTDDAYELEGCGVMVEYLAGADLYPGENAHLMTLVDQDNRAGFVLNGDSLALHYRVAGVSSYPPITFDPLLHRWWWIRPSMGMFEWLTSPDGQCWTSQQLHDPRLPSVLDVSLGAGTAGATDGFIAEFDNLNAPPP